MACSVGPVVASHALSVHSMLPDGNNDEMAVKTITFMQIYPYKKQVLYSAGNHVDAI